MLAIAAAVSLLLPAPVVAVAADGPRAAVASGCADVRVWRPPAKRASRLVGTPCGPSTSTGRGIASITLAGTRALWLSYTGGNIREWTLWTATTSRPRARQLRFETADVDGPAPVVLGEGDVSRAGDLLPYAVRMQVIVLRSNGSRAFAWTAPARVTALAAKAGRVAVGLSDGSVQLLDARGRELRSESFGTAPVDAVRLAGTALVVQQGRGLEIRGASPAKLTLARGIRLADAESGRIVLVGDGKVRLLDFSGRLLRSATGTHAALEGTRLYVGSRRTLRAG